MAHKPPASAALVVLMLLVPLLDGVVSMSARACGSAPCCAGKLHCPMHRSDAKPSSCRFGSCPEREVSLAAMPPIVIAATNEVRRPEPPALPLLLRERAALLDHSAPPDPPPPRLRG